MANVARSMQLKSEGNKYFLAKNYVGAESLYSKAIIADPTNAVLYTNRAIARLKLSLWDSAIDDCNTAIRLDPSNIKAHHNLSIAQTSIHDFDPAVENGRKAHDLCLKHNDWKSLPNILPQIRKAMSQRWDARERKRLRNYRELEFEVIELMDEKRRHMMENSMIDSQEDEEEIENEWREKGEYIEAVFEGARVDEQKRREIPEWLICDISFQIMIDPVVTRSGRTYERASILEHLKHQQIDPLTREPLYAHDLRPNLNLREACEDFVAKNGWAAEY